MRRGGRRGRGERARVEQRVRAILGTEAAPAQPRPSRHRAPNAVARLVAGTGLRLDGARSAAVAMTGAVLVVAVAVGLWVLSSRPRAIPIPASSASVPVAARSSAGARGVPTPTPTGSTSAGATSTSTAIVVDVAGKVRRPGIYRLSAGARVDDALRVAGGALPGVDLASLNLAALLADGQQVAVGVAPAPGSAPGSGLGSAAGGAAGSGSSGVPVHLNTATVEQLQTLPGVGPVLAQHILDYRSAHGSFRSVDQLKDVAGIGDAKFAALHDAVAL